MPSKPHNKCCVIDDQDIPALFTIISNMNTIEIYDEDEKSSWETYWEDKN